MATLFTRIIEALNILEGYPLQAMGHNSAEYIHKLAEALKLAYADRDTYYADPKFTRIPAERLLSKQYAAERRNLIGDRASLEFRPGGAVAVKLSYFYTNPLNVVKRMDEAGVAIDLD